MPFINIIFLSLIFVCFFSACVTQTQQNSQLLPSNKPTAWESSLPSSVISTPRPIASQSSNPINTPTPVMVATAQEIKLVTESINKLGFVVFKYLQTVEPSKNILFSPLNIYADLMKILKNLPADQNLKIRAKLGIESVTLIDLERILNSIYGKIENLSSFSNSEISRISFKSNFDAENYKSKTNSFIGSNKTLNGGFIDICKKSARFYKDTGFLYDKSYLFQRESSYTVEFIGAKLENSLKLITYAMTWSQWEESNKKSLNYQAQVCTTIPRFKSQINSKINLDNLFELTKINKTIEQSVFFDNTYSDKKLLEQHNFSSEYNLSMFEHLNLKQPFGIIVTGKYSSPTASEEQGNTIILMGLIQNLNRDELSCDINEGCTS